MQSTKPITITSTGIVMWLLVSGFFLYEFSLRTLVGTIGTQVISDLHLTAAKFAMLGSAYYLAYGMMQVPVGIIADKFGIRNTLLFGAAVCVLSAYGLALSSTFAEAFVCRVVMGFGSSFAFVCMLSVVAAWFPRKNFGLFSGMAQFIGTMGPMLAAGPLASILVRVHGDWRFLLNRIGLAGVVLVFLIFLFVRNKTVDKKKTLIFTKKQETVKSRLHRIVKNPQILWVSMYSALTYGPMALIGAIWGTIYLQSHGFSQSVAASTVSVAWLGYAIGCLSLGAISDFLKRRKVVLMSCSIIGFLATCGIVFSSADSIYVYMLLFGCLGVAASGQALACAAISEHSDASTRATAFGINNGSVILFNVFFPPIVGWTVSIFAAKHAGSFLPGDFFYGFCAMPLVYLLALTDATFFIDETYCKSQSEVIVLQMEDVMAAELAS